MKKSTQNNFNLKTAVSLITVCVLLSIFIPAGTANAYLVNCPLSLQNGRTIITFGDNGLRADYGEAEATYGPVNSWIVSGYYDITLVSYDEHSGHPGQNQPQESYYLILKNASGGLIANTPAISDLPDSQNLLTQKVATAFSITQDVSSITARHAAWPAGLGNPNSIAAVCVAFDRITISPDILIEKLIDDNGTLVTQNTAVPGDEITYVLKYENIGSVAANGVVVKDVFNYTNQEYLTFVSAVPAPDIGTIDTWSIGQLNPGVSGEIRITAQISTTVPSGTLEIKNRGSIDSNETAFVYSNCVSTFVTGTGSLSISKVGMNVDENSSWAEITNAGPSQKVAFSIQVANNGTATIDNVRVRDSLPYKLTYIAGSTQIDNVLVSDGLTMYTGLNLGSITVGQTKTITFEANVAGAGSFSIGNTILVNTASTWAIGITVINDTASVVVNKLGIVSLTITKQVRNMSDVSWYGQSTNADPGEEIGFVLEIKNNGTTTANNVKVWDNLPARLTYIANSTTVDGVSKTDGITGTGIDLGNMALNTTKRVEFRATVASANRFNSGITILTNYGYTSADGIASQYDIAVVNVDKSAGCSPSLHIDKLGRNITRGDGSFTNYVYANPGDELEFLININSIGTESAPNTKISDDLPSKLEYISGSTRVGGSYKPDGIENAGVFIGNLNVNDFREVKFRARVKSSSYFSSSITTLTNYVYGSAENGCRTVEDTAEIRVEKSGSNDYKGISISKLGRSITQGHTTWFDSFSANPGEEIEFSIQVSNIGNADLNNVRVWDALPVNLSIISGTTTINGANWGGDVIGNGILLGSLDKGQIKTIRFRATIAGTNNFGAGTTTLFNTSYANADNVSQVQDQASVLITKQGTVKGITTIKTGANTIGLIFLAIISMFIALFFYCRVREEKLLDILNNERTGKFIKSFIKLYFRTKFFFIAMRLRFKKVYW